MQTEARRERRVAAAETVSHWHKHIHGVLELVVAACSNVTVRLSHIENFKIL